MNDEELRAEILDEFKTVYRLAPSDYTENCTNIVMSIVNNWHTRKLKEARIDEIRRTRPHLTYPGMVYYGERMNELRSDEEEVK